jgi:hypothetical protein
LSLTARNIFGKNTSNRGLPSGGFILALSALPPDASICRRHARVEMVQKRANCIFLLFNNKFQEHFRIIFTMQFFSFFLFVLCPIASPKRKKDE